MYSTYLELLTVKVLQKKKKKKKIAHIVGAALRSTKLFENCSVDSESAGKNFEVNFFETKKNSSPCEKFKCNLTRPLRIEMKKIYKIGYVL